tara:strand:- start:107 stop:325 length:219 start_codon:yes stop_codon:yes gene_type:complete
MIDKFTFDQCKNNSSIRELKIKNLLHAIRESELILSESTIPAKDLIFLRRKIAESKQDLEILYLIKHQSKNN